MAGQGSYESDAAAVKGVRVVLRDFDTEARDSACQQLKVLGLMTFAMSGADVVIVPGEPSRRCKPKQRIAGCRSCSGPGTRTGWAQ